MDLNSLQHALENGRRLTAKEALELAETHPLEEICTLADNLRQHFIGNQFDTCSIINARSGRCPEDCKWCSQSKFHHTEIDIYPLVGAEETLKLARYNAAKGIRKFSLVTSGRTMTDSEIERACTIYREIGKQTHLHLCASMGLLTRDQLTQLKTAGVENYHCNLETAPSYFPQLCTTHTPEEKIQTIQWAKEVGLKICSGGIIGMGETRAQRVELALKLHEIGASSIPINLLNPIPGTKLAGTPPLPETELLLTFALFRILNPEAHIRFAGGRILIGSLQERALRCGVSAAIVGDMLTTVGSKIDQDFTLFKSAGFEL